LSPVRDPQAGAYSTRAPEKIALVGLRGSGKTTVGALLAGELQRPFADLDLELERAFASSHPSEPSARSGELLARLGEDEFRALESRALAEVLGRAGPLVLACGGGAVLSEENRARLREAAWVVWLDAPVEELARRLAADPTPRPPLTPQGRLAGAASLEELAAVRAARLPFYEEVAHLRIRTEGLSPAEVARFLRGGLGLPQA
jgi:shikimate kinase